VPQVPSATRTEDVSKGAYFASVSGTEQVRAT